MIRGGWGIREGLVFFYLTFWGIKLDYTNYNSLCFASCTYSEMGGANSVPHFELLGERFKENMDI